MDPNNPAASTLSAQPEATPGVTLSEGEAETLEWLRNALGFRVKVVARSAPEVREWRQFMVDSLARVDELEATGYSYDQRCAIKNTLTTLIAAWDKSQCAAPEVETRSAPSEQDSGTTDTNGDEKPYSREALANLDAQLNDWNRTGEANYAITSDCARRLIAMARRSLGSSEQRSERPDVAELERLRAENTRLADVAEEVRIVRYTLMAVGALLCDPVTDKNIRDARAKILPLYFDALRDVKAEHSAVISERTNGTD